MTIEYSLTRTDIVRSYFQGIGNSLQYLRTILMAAAIVAGFHLFLRVLATHGLSKFDLLVALLIFMLTPVVLPGIMFLMAKTQKRVLTISLAGISTTIGKKAGDIPWNKVKTVKDGQSFILVASATGNAFSIPNRAFATATDKARFLNEISRYRNQAQSAAN